jgi:hypothetical protein
MDTAPLRPLQRRLDAKSSSTEQTLQLCEARLAAHEASDRGEIEGVLDAARAKLEQLRKRILELDAAATVSAFSAQSKPND